MKLGIIGVLLILMLFTFASAVKKPRVLNNRKDGGIGQVNLVTMPEAGASSLDNKGLYDMLEQQVKSIELKRDPFTGAPIILDPAARPEFSLTGILWDKDNPLAIINNNVVKKGERVGRKKIVDIKQDKVILSEEETLSEIKLTR